MPPGYAKTEYGSELLPAHFFAQEPNLDVVGASHGSGLAETISGKTQKFIRANAETLGYGLLTQRVDEWETTNGGTYHAVGVGGSITGRRSNLTVIDDPFKGHQDAESETMRQKVWDWYTSEIYTREKAGSKNRIVLICTRWHPDDLAGRLIEKMGEAGSEQWRVLRLPAICESTNDPLGRRIGEALWPEHQDEARLAQIRLTVEEYVWGALYQQNPRPRGATFFNVDWLLVDAMENGMPTKVPVAMPDKCDVIFAVIDTAIKSGSENNSTAVAYYSFDALRRPMQARILDWDITQIDGDQQIDWLPSIIQRGEELATECRARQGFIGAFIEDKATGPVLISRGRRLGMPVHAINSEMTAVGKDERAVCAQPFVIAEDFKITELAFNKTKHHKGRSANHLLSQVSNFRLGSGEKDGKDLLDTFCYGVLLAYDPDFKLSKKRKAS